MHPSNYKKDPAKGSELGRYEICFLSVFLGEGFWHIFWGQEFYGLNPAQVTWQQRVLGTAMVRVIIIIITTINHW